MTKGLGGNFGGNYDRKRRAGKKNIITTASYLSHQKRDKENKEG